MLVAERREWLIEKNGAKVLANGLQIFKIGQLEICIGLQIIPDLI